VQLTRLNNQPITLNSDLIKFLEQAPDTVITLISGEKIVVREKAVEVIARVVAFRRSVLEGIFPTWDHIPPVPAPSLKRDQDDQGDTAAPEGKAGECG
jgi:flagellar protein FlbD